MHSLTAAHPPRGGSGNAAGVPHPRPGPGRRHDLLTRLVAAEAEHELPGMTSTAGDPRVATGLDGYRGVTVAVRSRG
ncbi:hypothetical protein KIK06_05700 [Nocardiopsis sp. EMB25]|uniref:hypothetical protein n=1 Tax=Nocardiopsis sp. EMB25 TaxID=2835867 RepID=UPI0022846A1E|nr:hypothetical protein [Nocardiopsis sp. EMB25]MCY9783388.1 hypothetical protein [Nocardiopsis sp. EMB25]